MSGSGNVIALRCPELGSYCRWLTRRHADAIGTAEAEDPPGWQWLTFASAIAGGSGASESLQALEIAESVRLGSGPWWE